MSFSRRRVIMGLAFGAFYSPQPAGAIVVRHDTPAARYLARPDAFPPIADLPGEGHGVLIAPSWVVTVAHTLTSPAVSEIAVADRARPVARIILHPEYEPLSGVEMVGDAAPLMVRLNSLRDIALIELQEPITDVRPASMYRSGREEGRLVRILGRGATGTGLEGEPANAPHRGPLRLAYNRIESAAGRWLSYRFDREHRLEGIQGGGDSGGPVLLRDHGEWKLAGLASWRSWNGDLARFRGGVYGQSAFQTRISFYAGWIDGVISAP